MSDKYWKIRAAAGAGGAAEILIYEPIGQGVFSEGLGAKQFAEELKALGDISQLDIRINSPGGNVFEGLAIHSTLAAHRARKTVHVDGLAASIASVIAMAGDRIVMPENALMMVHDPSGLCAGTAKDMRELASIMEKVKTALIAAYRRTKLSDARISELMAAETWMTAAEAVELGFADEIATPMQIAALFDLSGFRNAPRGNVSGDIRPIAGDTRELGELMFQGIEPDRAAAWAANAWDVMPAARAEFTSKAAFVAYCRASASGRTQVHSGKVVTFRGRPS